MKLSYQFATREIEEFTKLQPSVYCTIHKVISTGHLKMFHFNIYFVEKCIGTREAISKICALKMPVLLIKRYDILSSKGKKAKKNGESTK